LGTTVSELAAEAELHATGEADEALPSDPAEQEERDVLRHYWQLDRASRSALRQIMAQMAQAAIPHVRRHA